MERKLPHGFMLYVRYNIEGCMNHIRRIYKSGKTPTYKDVEMYSIPIGNYALDMYSEPIKILDDIYTIDSYISLSPEHRKWMVDTITSIIESGEMRDNINE